jgi:hypothetical protein
LAHEKSRNIAGTGATVGLLRTDKLHCHCCCWCRQMASVDSSAAWNKVSPQVLAARAGKAHVWTGRLLLVSTAVWNSHITTGARCKGMQARHTCGQAVCWSALLYGTHTSPQVLAARAGKQGTRVRGQAVCHLTASDTPSHLQHISIHQPGLLIQHTNQQAAGQPHCMHWRMTRRASWRDGGTHTSWWHYCPLAIVNSMR